MMLYAINGEDVPDSLEKRKAVRSAHLERISILQKEGRRRCNQDGERNEGGSGSRGRENREHNAGACQFQIVDGREANTLLRLARASLATVQSSAFRLHSHNRAS